MTTIKNYINQMKINDASPSAYKNAEAVLRKLESFTNKSIDVITKDDLTNYLLHLKEIHTQGTMNVKLHYIRNFFISVDKEDFVKAIKIKRINQDLDPKEVLTPEDVNLLIRTTSNVKYKAIMALLYESGVRISELLAVKMTDIEETAQGMILTVQSEKTKGRTNNSYRKIPLINSAGYVRNYLMYVNLSDDDFLFPENRDRNAVNLTIRKIAEKSGIKKHVTCHKFRHAGATKDALDGMQESILRQKYGWTKNSNMIERYLHLGENAVVDSVFKTANGDKVPDIEGANETVIQKLQSQNAALMQKMANLEMNEEAIIERLMKRFPGLAGVEA